MCRRVPSAWIERCDLSLTSLAAYTQQLRQCTEHLRPGPGTLPNTYWMPSIRHPVRILKLFNLFNLNKIKRPILPRCPCWIV